MAANTYTWGGGSGNWTVPGNWTPLRPSYPGQSGTSDIVTIGSVGPGTITYDPSSATIGWLTLSGSSETLDFSGTNNSLTINITAFRNPASNALIAGTNNTLSMSGTNQTLTINLGGWSTTLLRGAGDVLALGSNTLRVDSASGTPDFYLSSGLLTLAGGSVNITRATLRLESGATISGHGTLYSDSIISTGSGTGGALTASGGVLNVSTTNLIQNHIVLGVDASVASDLEIFGIANQAAAIDLHDGNQTLGLGNTGALTITAKQVVTGGTVKLDGGTASLTDTYGVNLGGGSFLSGAGTVTVGSGTGVPGPGSGFNGGGTVTAKFVSPLSYTLTFNGGVDQTGSATNFSIESGATLAFKGLVGTSGGISPTVSFQTDFTAVETLDLSAAPLGSFFGNIQNFYKINLIGSDRILIGGSATTNQLFYTDVNGNVYTGGDDTAYTYVTVKDGSTLIDRINMGSYHNATSVGFKGITERTTLETTDTICFMAGTMIRTPGGEVAVETLKRGDLVLTADGRAEPVSWLGRQTVSTRFADPLRVLPIRIMAGALAENVPARDLLVSPDHALLVDGALINAGALVNDASILRETAVPVIFTYYHVELDDHSLILAENTPAETFVDNVERLAFDNWAEHEALYPEGKSITELPYPRAKGRRQVPVYVRVQLAERAEIIGASVAVASVA
ncbi:Hint domain-containing protein [uncultured Rhodoblastus sp.]|uniref:Hint domain-containing protein n=1 Tax=uncultured Rhodoblastus sp. TaxID=543037 RepID=UPI0025F46907|nr:Hint domain-containing protein [uncultured Rhodoblastus sp.]